MAPKTIETTEKCRHVFLYYKNRVSWPPCFESSDADPLPKLFISTWKALKDNMTIVETKIAVCEVNEDPYFPKTRGDFSDGDVLIFPDMIKYRGLVESNVESFFEDVLVNRKPWSAGVPEVLTGSYIYVCARKGQDVRTHGSMSYFMERFNVDIRRIRPYNEIYLTICCHVCGHDKYAGRAIIYSQGPDGKTSGHWCVFPTPQDVADRLTQHIVFIKKCDQVKPSVAVVKGADDQKLANGENTYKGKEDDYVDIRIAVGVLGVAAATVAGAYLAYKSFRR